MQVIKINNKDPEPIILNLYHKKDKDARTLLFVGGSGDDRSKFKNIAHQLLEKNVFSKVVTISFRGTETQRERPLTNQIDELEEILNYLVEKLTIKTLDVVCTSAGALSTTWAITNPKNKLIFREAVYIDPADYYLAGNSYKTYSGFQEFNPSKAMASVRLKSLKSEVKVHVINLMIRNYGPTGYPKEEERGIDNPKLYKRLNSNMVEEFWKNLPNKNKGKYIEDRTLPHAFVRDGDIYKNEARVVELITNISVLPSKSKAGPPTVEAGLVLLLLWHL